MRTPLPILTATLVAIAAAMVTGCETRQVDQRDPARSSFMKTDSPPVKRSTHQPNKQERPDGDPATTEYLR